jgi:O-antigen/teichoic acid export membrane protein
MSLARKIAFNTGVQIASKIVTVSLTLLTTILLTSYLGKEGYGAYIYVLNLIIIFGSLADWGTATIGVREVAKEENQRTKLIGNLLALRLLLSLMAMLALFIFSFWLPWAGFIRLASPIIVLVSIKAFFAILFQAQLEMQKAALADMVASLFIFIFSALVIKKGFDFGLLIWSVIWATLLSALLAAFLARKSFKYRFTLDKKIIKHLLIESLPMGAILLMFTIDNKIDTVMLGLLKGSGEVGIYGLSSRIYDVLILGAAFLMNALLPVLSNLTELKYRPRLISLLEKTFLVIFLGGLAVALIVLLFSPFLVRVLTQKNFYQFFNSIAVLKIMALSLFIAYFNHLVGYTLVALNQQRPYFWIALGSLIFNLTANWWLIPLFSYYGAAWVTVFTEGLVLISTSALLYRYLTAFNKTPYT